MLKNILDFAYGFGLGMSLYFMHFFHIAAPWPMPRKAPCTKCGATAILRRVRKPKRVQQSGEIKIVYPSVMLCEPCIYSVEIL